MGYEYETCLDMVLWEKRTAALQGYELDASNMGGWMLDKHHILDIQNGECGSCRLCVITISVADTGGPSRFYKQVVFTRSHRNKYLNQNEI